MSGTGVDLRIDRALGRMREAAGRGVPLPGGGFADVERRRLRRRRRVLLRTALGLAVVLGAGLAWWTLHAAGGGGLPGPRGLAPAVAAPAPAPPPPASVTPAPPPPRAPAAERFVTYVAEAGAVVRELDPRTWHVERGTVWFAVEPGHGGAEVRTGACTVVVRGTVFAVSVDAAGRGAGTRVGVLTGKVVVVDRGADIEVGAGRELPEVGRETAPLAEAWRQRLTELFPERVATETAGAPPVVAEAAPTVATVGPPPVAPAPPSIAVVNGHRGPARAAGPTWAERYDEAVRLLRTDPAAATAQLEALSASAPSVTDAQTILLDLGRAYRKLGDLRRARAAYEQYLERHPGGPMREDARLALCAIFAALHDAAAERACLEAYLREFPEGSKSAEVARRLAEL